MIDQDAAEEAVVCVEGAGRSKEEHKWLLKQLFPKMLLLLLLLLLLSKKKKKMKCYDFVVLIRLDFQVLFSVLGL